MKKFVVIVVVLWGLMFALPFMYGEAKFNKGHIGFGEDRVLFIEKAICGHKFEIPQTFDECNGFKMIKLPKKVGNRFMFRPTTDRSYKIKSYEFVCYDFSEKNRILDVTNVDGTRIKMKGDKTYDF